MKKLFLAFSFLLFGFSQSSFAQTYCTSTFSFPSSLYTSNVTFGAINNNSAGSGYADYTNLSTVVAPGTIYPISATITPVSTSPAHIGAYFDWNQDFDFDDPGEYYYLGYNGAASSPVTINGNISVPNNIQTGPTRMRILMRYGTSGFPTDPCYNGSLGETEDYTVVVASTVPLDIGISSIDEPSVFCAGTEDIVTTIRNFGTDQITSATVNWAVNGILQPPYNFSGLIDTVGGTGSTTAQAIIGSVNFANGVSYDIEAWTSDPNGSPDTMNTNDSSSGIFQASLQGNMTIGGVGADFIDLQSASNALASFGVCGPVNFTINPGTYLGYSSFSEIPGVSSVNQVVFDGVDNGLVTLSNDGQVQNATILIDGADWLAFRNITIENTKSAWSAWGVRLANGADHNTIEHCKVRMAPGPNSDRTGIIATSSNQFADGQGNNANYTQIIECEFSGGYEGIHFEGSNSLRTTGNLFMGNRFSSIEFYGIFCEDQDSNQIVDNHIPILNNPNGAGVILEDAERFRFEGNYVHAVNNPVRLRFPNMDSSGIARFANNMIISEAGPGIHVNGGALVDFYHNSAKGEPAVFFLGSHISHQLVNNIFTSATDYAFESATTLTFGAVDHNIYYSENPTLLAYYGGSYPSLSAWQAADPSININSLEGDPLYKSSTDLSPTSPIANNTGDSLGILLDFNGNSRDVFTPDIGAIEYDIYSNDVGVLSIDSPLAFCPGVENVVVTIQNYGNTRINSLTINWAINGAIQPSVAYNQLIDTIGGTGSAFAQVALGSFNFIVNTAYSIEAWTSNPNGGSDPNSENDSIMGVRKGALAGVLTVGGPGADFNTLTQAAADLMLAGVCGPVTFNINPGTYHEFIQLGEIDGASDINTITFDGGNRDSVFVVHDGLGQNSVIFLNGSDWITFRNMTLENTYNAATGWGVLLTGQADHNTIDSCKIIQPVALSFNRAGVVSSGSSVSATTEGNNANFTTVSNCHIVGGYTGIHFEGSSSQKNQGNRALNNTIEMAWAYGINADEQDSATYRGNHISDLRTTVTAYGMQIYDHNGFIIDRNYIHSTGWGLRMNDANSDLPMGTSLITNNMIISEGNEGISIQDANSLDIFHNSVLGEPGIRLAGLLVMVDLRNNIFTSMNDYAFETVTSPPLTLDYNIYHVFSGSFFVRYNVPQPDLPTWQLANPLLNMNSLSGDPEFISNTDLHLIGILASDSGAPVGVIEDFDGDVRSFLTPDIGADEYAPAQFDMSVTGLASPSQDSSCFNGPSALVVNLKNAGLGAVDFSLSQMVVSVKVSGPVPDSISTTVSDNSLNGGLPLAPGDSILVNLGNITVGSLGDYTFEQFIDFAADEQPINDYKSETMSLGVISGYPYLEDFETFVVGNDGTGFDNGWLNLVPDIPTTNEYRWVVNSGGTPNFASGPSAANTTGNYVYTRGASPGFDAHMVAACISIDSIPLGKMDFEYHMYGNDIGTIDIDVFNGTTWVNGLWSLTGQQQVTENDPWIKATLDLSSFSGDVRVRFRGTRGAGNQGDICIDNVRFYSPPPTDISAVDFPSPVLSTCLNGVENVTVSLYNSGSSPLDFSTNNLNIKVPISGLGSGLIDTTFTSNAFIGGLPLPAGDTLEVTIGTVDMSAVGAYNFDLIATLSGDMDNSNDSVFDRSANSEQLLNSFPYLENFELFTSTINATGWTNGWTSDPINTTVPFRWQPDHGGTPTALTGPEVDHTLGDPSGKYIYTESSQGVSGSEAMLYSPCFDITGISDPMLEFYYHMFGNTTGSMELDVFDGTDWHLGVWSLTGPQQFSGFDPWLRATVNLTTFANSNEMKYRLRGVRAAGGTGDMAIDDAKFQQTPDYDLEADSITGISSGCGLDTNESIQVNVFNRGKFAATGFDIEYDLGSGWIFGTTISTSLNPGAQQQYTVTGVDLSNPGAYVIQARVVFALDEDSTNDVTRVKNVQNLFQPEIQSTTGDEVCESGSLSLSAASNADSLFWYDDPALTNLVNTGTTYFIANATTTQTFYLQGRNSNGCSSNPATVVGTVSQNPDMDFTFVVNGATVDFTSAIGSAFDSVFWDFGDLGTSTQLNPSHTYTNTQTYVVTHTGYSGSCEADTSKGVFVNVGIDDNPWSAAIQAFPNPTDGKFSIEIPQANGLTIVEVFDMKGGKVFSRNFEAKGSLSVDMDLSAEEAGVFILRISNGDNSSTKRITLKE